jgi:putative flippase GtrA
MISIICYVTNNLLLIGFDKLGAPLWLSLVVSASSVIVLGFVLHAWLTFEAPLSWRGFARFTLVQLPNVPIAYALLWLLNERLGLAMHYSAPMVTTLLLLWNALGSMWAFKKR